MSWTRNSTSALQRVLETYVAARAVDLSIVVGIEVDDLDLSSAVMRISSSTATHVDGSATIVLHDLVGSVVCTTTDDPSLLPSFIIFDRYGVLTDILKPDEFESAWAVAVNTFCLVGSNNDVLESCARPQKEHGVGITFMKSVSTFPLGMAAARVA